MTCCPEDSNDAKEGRRGQKGTAQGSSANGRSAHWASNQSIVRGAWATNRGVVSTLVVPKKDPREVVTPRLVVVNDVNLVMTMLTESDRETYLVGSVER